MSRIIVGVDGSDTSQHALEWAASEAKLRGEELQVVHVVEPSDHAREHTTPPPVTPSTSATRLLADRERELHAQRARRNMAAAESLLDRMLARVDTAGVEVRPIAVPDARPARRLIELSREPGASHLVVGARGRGGFRELILGSVGEQCVAYAGCPVTVVRDSAAERR